MVALLVFICYVAIVALIGGWLYAKDYDDRWFYVAACWPLVPFVAIVGLIGYLGYRAGKFFNKL